MKRASTIALAALLALAGCRDMGLAGNGPLERAEQMAPAELVTAVHAPTAGDAEVVMDGRLWVPWGVPTAGDALDLRPVGSAHGVTVYARYWDRSPYDEIFTRDDAGDWQGHAPVIGHGGGAATAAN